MVVDVCFFLLLATITAFAVIFWTRLFKSSFREYLGVQHPTPFGLVDVLICFFAWIGIPSLVIGIMMSVYQVESWAAMQPEQQGIASLLVSIAQLLTVSAVFVWAAMKYGGPGKTFGLKSNKFNSDIRIALKTFVMVLPPLLLIQWLLAQLVPYKHTTLEVLRENFSLMAIITGWLGAVIAAPICEEVFFRGFLQGWLQRVRFDSNPENSLADVFGGWSTDEQVQGPVNVDGGVFEIEASEAAKQFYWWLPILLSSALFAAVHIGQGLAPVALFFFGIALGFLYKWTGSILPAIILHFCLNAFSMFWTTLELALSNIKDAL